MTTPTPHPYAHILRAIAEGLNVQWQSSDGRWQNQRAAETLSEISNEEYRPARYRVHVRTITINGHEVPEALRIAPPEDTEYWLPAMLMNPSCGHVLRRVWTDCEDHHRWLQQGLVHLTREAASAHAKALISITASK